MSNIKINNAIFGKDCIVSLLPFHLWDLDVTYWGWSQWYKWRWNVTHIDMGIISIYNLPQKGIGRLFWRFVSICIKPMRMLYHRRFVPKSKKLNEMVKDLTYFK